jgi:Putative addiction module component
MEQPETSEVYSSGRWRASVLRGARLAVAARSEAPRGKWSCGSGKEYAHGMSRTLEQIEDEVLRLPEESRVRLMERLLSSFQEQAGSEEEGIARAWVDEAERRDDEMSSGREEGLPAQEVISKLRSSRR